MAREIPVEHRFFLSTEIPSKRRIGYAIAAVIVSVVFFALTIPFAKLPLGQFPSFIPVYVSSFIISDLITAVILFGQFSVLRTRALLILAAAYLFSAAITLGYALVFPGMVAPSGLFGAGPQTTSAFYMFWHSGFPIAIIFYALLKGKDIRPKTQVRAMYEKPQRNILLCVAGVLALVAAFTWFATAGHQYIPIFLLENRTTDTGRAFLFGVWILSFVALIALWFRKPHTMLDVWMMTIMCVWIFDIALSAILNTGRYDLGWYVGRMYGLLGASFLLAVLLVENGKQYARLVELSLDLSQANKTLAQVSRQDALTELANRRAFDEYLAEQLSAANRHHRSVTLVLYDVDHFKAYNDYHGHLGGDACLKLVAAALRSCCNRQTDMCARYGGEEFAMILPDTPLEGASQIAENARKAVGIMRIPHPTSPLGMHVSISGGLAVLHAKGEITAERLISEADKCLYEAKNSGRDRIVCVAG